MENVKLEYFLKVTVIGVYLNDLKAGRREFLKTTKAYTTKEVTD
jgi:hypothetical protein